MKKLAVTLLALLLFAGQAHAEAGFTYKAYFSFQGEEVVVRIQNDGKHAGEMVQIRDEEGNVLVEAQLIGFQGRQNVSFISPTGKAGVTMSIWREGADAPDDTALLACETRPGYSITRVDTEEKKIAITFDSANAVSKTPKILDLLDEYGAKCTFFLQGTFVKGNPEIVREIEARGHELANHSYAHPEMPELTNDEIIADFNKSDAIFTEVLGHSVSLYRPPSGSSTQRDRAIARALGQEVIKWDIDSRDGFEDSTLNTILYRVKNNAGPGSIILMHVYGRYTLDALNILLPYYIEQGYEFVTVSDLLLEGDTYIDTDGVLHAAAE
ncbi:MAG: polysaccharide deacetylase family protein [Clostridia bacterium]|nr:polysaccharide deacetylase family protein [Clostridia bacterium]